MAKIYLPITDLTDFQCYSVYDRETIRAYNSTPQYNTSSNYTDFYIHSNYLTKNGNQTFSQYTNLPTCINSSDITNNVFYRTDINDILCSTFIILIVCFYFPYKIISRLFGRWLKL